MQTCEVGLQVQQPARVAQATDEELKLCGVCCVFVGGGGGFVTGGQPYCCFDIPSSSSNVNIRLGRSSSYYVVKQYQTAFCTPPTFTRHCD